MPERVSIHTCQSGLPISSPDRSISISALRSAASILSKRPVLLDDRLALTTYRHCPNCWAFNESMIEGLTARLHPRPAPNMIHYRQLLSNQAVTPRAWRSRAMVIAVSSIMSSWPPTILRRPSSNSSSRAGTPYLASARLANSRKEP